LATYYASKQADYDLAKKSNPNADVRLYEPGTQLKSGDYYLGGASGINLNGATALTGADRYETNSLFNSEVYKNDYASKLAAAQNQIAQAEAEAKRQALLGAYQSNKQTLNSQQSTVGNNYSSLINQLNTTKQAQLPQYQDQRDQTSAEAAAQLRRTQALNALTGKFHSGTNRSQMSDVGLARSKALGNINQAQNQFETGITNQMSEADAQRVAALNDIAEKLSLVKQQYNSGTLSLENQLASTEAANASKAMADAMVWAEKVERQRLDDSYRQEQFDYEKSLNEWEKAFKEREYEDNLAINRAQLAASLAKGSGGSGGSGSSGSKLTQSQMVAANTANVLSELQAAVNSGRTRDEILKQIQQNKVLLVRDMVDMDIINSWLEDIVTADEQASIDKQSAAEANQEEWDSLSFWDKLRRGTIFN